MTMYKIRRVYKVVFVILMIFCAKNVQAQLDSSSYWVVAINDSKTLDQAIKTEEAIQGYFDRNTQFITMSNIEKILRAAAKNRYCQKVFYELFYCFHGRTLNTKLETDFNLFVIKLEHDKDFSNPTVSNQLNYYYGTFFYSLREYFSSEKCIKLFLKNGRNCFPINTQENYEFNANTILAIIELNQNNFSESLKILNTTLDNAIAKDNKAWIGITKGNIGSIFYEQGNYQEAIKYLLEDCRSSMQNNEIGSALGSYLLLKNIYSKQGNQVLANNCLDSAFVIYQKILKDKPSNELLYLKEGLELNNSLAERYYLQNDFEKASNFYKLGFDLSNKIDQKEKARLLKKTIETIQIDKNLNEINELNNEIRSKREFLLFFITIAILAIGLLIVYISFYGRLKKANKNLKEIKTIISQQNLDLEKLNKEKDLLFSLCNSELLTLAEKQQHIIESMINNDINESDYNKVAPNLFRNNSALIAHLKEISKSYEKASFSSPI